MQKIKTSIWTAVKQAVCSHGNTCIILSRYRWKCGERYILLLPVVNCDNSPHRWLLTTDGIMTERRPTKALKPLDIVFPCLASFAIVYSRFNYVVAITVTMMLR